MRACVRLPPSHNVTLNLYPNEFTKLVILNLFQDNTATSPVILKQVQDDASWFRMTMRNLKNHFPTNNQIGYLIRVMQAAV